MWILLVIWIIFFVDAKVINECSLVLHTLATAVCQLYLALVLLRHAVQHIARAAWKILIEPRVNDFDQKLSSYSTDEERFWYLLPYFRKAAVRYLEGVCLLWDSLSQLLAVASTLCVAVGHVLQGALFLGVSAARWAQQMLLFKEDVDEWVKEQKQQRDTYTLMIN
ncbi:hypothetical protein ABG768_014605 [Culter alburnus]|uniref:Uncharacterized protein n=1 Tax=Culter alburnus TaxID=194366 RepID=A0AAW1Z6A1_CULAL